MYWLQMLGELIKIYAKEKVLKHYLIKSNGTHAIKGSYHIQAVNGVHSRLKQWSERLKMLQVSTLRTIWLDFDSWINEEMNPPSRILKICHYLLSPLR